MSKAIITTICITLISLWAIGAIALEGPWLKKIDSLERAEEAYQKDAHELKLRSLAMDELLFGRLTDSDTAERATRQLRRDVSEMIAREHRLRRSNQRAMISEGPLASQRMQKVKSLSSHFVENESWRSKSRLLADVDEGVEEGLSLFFRKAAMEVHHAELLGNVGKVRAERDFVIQLVSDGNYEENLSEEFNEAQENLDQEMENLSSQRGEDFHRRKGALLPPLRGAPSHPYGPRKQNESMSYIRHTGLT